MNNMDTDKDTSDPTGSYCLELIKGGGELILVKGKGKVKRQCFVLGEDFLSSFKDVTEKDNMARGHRKGS